MLCQGLPYRLLDLALGTPSFLRNLRMLALNTSWFTIASALQLAANLVSRLEKHLPGE
jgi:hypothetical protein